MKTLRHLALLTVTAGFFMATGNRASAQVSVSIGAPPVCHMGTTKSRPTTVLPMATMARSGLTAVYSSVPDLGITGGNIFTVTSITVTIFARAIMTASQRAVSAQQKPQGISRPSEA